MLKSKKETKIEVDLLIRGYTSGRTNHWALCVHRGTWWEHLVGFLNNQVTFKRKLRLVQRKEMDGFDSDRKNYCKQGKYMKGRNSISQYEYNSLFSLK